MSCQDGKNLFEASCDSNGFLIKINQDSTTRSTFRIFEELSLRATILDTE